MRVSMVRCDHCSALYEPDAGHRYELTLDIAGFRGIQQGSHGQQTAEVCSPACAINLFSVMVRKATLGPDEVVAT